MSNKHFTTSDVRNRRNLEARAIRLARQQRAEERRALMDLQRKFDVRSGRTS